ncbi:MAG: hypothetical protein WCX46_02665 [Candidatus Paceibacterota bacterium]
MSFFGKIEREYTGDKFNWNDLSDGELVQEGEYYSLDGTKREVENYKKLVEESTEDELLKFGFNKYIIKNPKQGGPTHFYMNPIRGDKVICNTKGEVDRSFFKDK